MISLSRSIVLALALITTGSFAADKNKPIIATFPNEVVAVSSSSITISVSTGVEKKYGIAETTKVMVDNKKATIDDVKPGMKATVIQHAGAESASSITAVTMMKKGKK